MKDSISWLDFEKIDIRVGTIIAVLDFEKATKPSYILHIDFGELGVKKSSAQITKLYSKEALLNKQIIAVVNFPKKQIANFFSECLVLGIVAIDHNITLIQPERLVENGLRIA